MLETQAEAEVLIEEHHRNPFLMFSPADAPQSWHLSLSRYCTVDAF